MLSPHDLLPQPFSLSRVLRFLPSCILSVFLSHSFLRVCQYSCHLTTTSWPGVRQTVTRGSCIGRVHSSLLKSIELPTCAVWRKCDITYLEIRYVFKHKWVGNSNLFLNLLIHCIYICLEHCNILDYYIHHCI